MAKLPKAQAAALMATPDDIEAQFYEALQSGDLDKLMAVWSDDDDIVCVHPGGPRVVGAVAIRASFSAIFAHGGVNARASALKRVTTPTTSIHSVMERIEIRTSEGGQAAWVIATNVYVKTTQGWRLAVHHASPGEIQDSDEITVQRDDGTPGASSPPGASTPPTPSTLH